MAKLKKLLIVLVLCFLFTGCSTISHKNIETTWQGYGASIDYKSTVAIDAADIPAFIKAVDKLEKLLRGEL